jgi:DNA-binding CsgD family transcriptional regulator
MMELLHLDGGIFMKRFRQRQKRQKLSPGATAPPSKRTPDMSEVSSTNIVDHVQYFIHLLSIGQMLYGQTCGIADRLCQEVKLITQGHAQLVLHLQGLIDRAQLPSPSQTANFPVQSGDLNYGTLYVVLDPAQPTHPLIPASVAASLAQLCAMLVHFLEVSALIQLQYKHLELQALEPLTKRQREVLALLCHGYDREKIAKALSIAPTTVDTHRQHLYERLGVHNDHDILLAAYHAGLFSPIEGISGHHF